MENINIPVIEHDKYVNCKMAIEKAIDECFEDNKISSNCAAKVIANFDNACIRGVLRRNLILKYNDNRFSESNKKWGWITEWGCLEAMELRRKEPDCDEYIINSHPCLVNAFIDQFRKLDNE